MKLLSNSAIVTGGAQGIGLAVASRLMREGTSVLVFGRTETKVADAAERLNREAEGRARAVPFAGDVCRAEDVARAHAFATEQLGLPGILVNNAGSLSLTLLVDLPEEELDRVLAVNLKGPFLMLKTFARALIAEKRAGAVVNITSVCQEVVTEGFAHYSASKAALAQLSRSAALELGRHGIRVNVVAPGATLTPVAAAFIDEPSVRRELLARTPLGRAHGMPEDVARAVTFLCSEESSWVTGESLFVDGGSHLRGLHSYWDTLNPPR
ncbi:SDR family oxidoreductase [Myxococcus sp. CA051A]|uniref:SDR family oxidoreductase n=1 Tax=Myxococcus llanfairpwllgwyngyllgogerychwyrndrobwllllantysiliogogogochensis TaxID=2590453 RepID=A0A540WMK3_9BACT|nr:SDR family oxidoreductase [Myxococcus llanfairpwllgwyngyllgogerychwyrndrobwllllantysiliogogogochensis]NTX00699.1 SDR family oxidoreductase [Myxococcus sp. CA040A]NTX12596.1 SDR family oxidoreductase [Myxococcus sp. CA056]NTX33615.1 SDR family oxidoreductase [Myxococcus sp. CA033]NTX53471.1 SDR family oxidoreductase [Myxococcus sp. CA039A]NTX59278.1 SDR family oxidoreductase [Myxococcus sp. CA051A]